VPQCVLKRLTKEAAALEAKGRSPEKDEQSISDKQDKPSFRPEGKLPTRVHEESEEADFKPVKHPDHSAKMFHSEKTGQTFALGLLDTPPGTDPEPTTFVSLAALPTSYNPFTENGGNDCLKNYPARDQGQCGSCYAFAASTMLALNYCLKAAAARVTYPDATPAYSTQGFVSCGSKRKTDLDVFAALGKTYVPASRFPASHALCGLPSPLTPSPSAPAPPPPRLLGCSESDRYTEGCNGAIPALTMDYLEDVGVTWAGCNPYVSGGGDFKQHFSSPKGAKGACLSDCTAKWKTDHPSTPIRFFKGKNSKKYVGEADIKAAIKKHGALFCQMMVANDFMSLKSNDVYEVGEGQNPNGGHAIVLYGWGQTAKGTKYWDGVNSWGSGWGYGGKSLLRIKRGDNTASIETGCWSTEPFQEIQGFAPPLPPRPPPPPSPPPCIPLEFIMSTKSYGSVRAGPDHIGAPPPSATCLTCPRPAHLPASSPPS
jgi:hypothetical protein